LLHVAGGTWRVHLHELKLQGNIHTVII
jgi:hypothetical protein